MRIFAFTACFLCFQVYAIHSLQPQHFYYGACVDVSLNGTYTCTWNPRVVGIYNMTVTLNGPGNVTVPTANIIGSPFHPNITFGALNPSQCLAVGAGVAVSLVVLVPLCLRVLQTTSSVYTQQNALLNFPVTFYILNRDTYGNSRPVNDFTGVTLSTDAMSDITNISWAYVANDTFSVKYTPLSTGAWVFCLVSRCTAPHIPSVFTQVPRRWSLK